MRQQPLRARSIRERDRTGYYRSIDSLYSFADALQIVSRHAELAGPAIWTVAPDELIRRAASRLKDDARDEQLGQAALEILTAILARRQATAIDGAGR